MASFLEKLRMDRIYPEVFKPRTIEQPQMGRGTGLEAIARNPSQNQTMMENIAMQHAGLGLQKARMDMQNAQTPNVVYDPQPEQHSQEVKLQRDKMQMQQQAGEEERALAERAMTDDWQQQQRENALRNKQIETTAGFKGAELGLKGAKFELDRYKAMNPNLRFIPTQGGNVIGFDPKTGQSFDTGIASGTLSAEDRIRLGGEVSRENITHATDEGIRRDTARTEGRPQIPQQDMARLKLRVNQMLSQHPEWADYIEIDEAGLPQVKSGERGPVGNFFGIGGIPPEVRSQIMRSLYGPDDTQMQGPQSLSGVSMGGDTVTMYDPQGNELRVPKDKVKALEAQGATTTRPRQ
jgi:hypothetical protein